MWFSDGAKSRNEATGFDQKLNFAGPFQANRVVCLIVN
jgi:hypothetical protein